MSNRTLPGALGLLFQARAATSDRQLRSDRRRRDGVASRLRRLRQDDQGRRRHGECLRVDHVG
eukprot:4360891-Pleurochrysis_carterae.AAC.1